MKMQKKLLALLLAMLTVLLCPLFAWAMYVFGRDGRFINYVSPAMVLQALCLLRHIDVTPVIFGFRQLITAEPSCSHPKPRHLRLQFSRSEVGFDSARISIPWPLQTHLRAKTMRNPEEGENQRKSDYNTSRQF